MLDEEEEDCGGGKSSFGIGALLGLMSVFGGGGAFLAFFAGGPGYLPIPV